MIFVNILVFYEMILKGIDNQIFKDYDSRHKIKFARATCNIIRVILHKKDSRIRGQPTLSFSALMSV